MVEFNPENERLKHRFMEYLKGPQQLADSTVQSKLDALNDYEKFIGCKPFKHYKYELATAYKKHLATRLNRNGKLLSTDTAVHRLLAVEEFFIWLGREPGYKSCFKHQDVRYFRPSGGDQRAANYKAPPPAPTIEQLRRAILSMPTGNDIDQEHQAMVAFLAFTCVRVSALISLRIKHINLAERLVTQKPPEVKTKNSKFIQTYFVPLIGEDIIEIFISYYTRRREEKKCGYDDPLFPSEKLESIEGRFQSTGLSSNFWATSAPARAIVKQAFIGCGIQAFCPHSFRHTLIRTAIERGMSLEQLKALSLNIGHENLETSLIHYGQISTHMQGKIIREMADWNDSKPRLSEQETAQLMKLLLKGRL